MVKTIIKVVVLPIAAVVGGAVGLDAGAQIGAVLSAATLVKTGNDPTVTTYAQKGHGPLKKTYKIETKYISGDTRITRIKK